MFTSFSIDCSLSGSWLASRPTTSFSVLSWFVVSSNVEVLAVIRWTCLGGTLRVTDVTANNGFPRSIMIRVWIWLAWLGTFGLLNNFSIWSLSNFWTHFLHPVMFQGNLWRRTKWRIYLLENDFSSVHPNNFRDTISWECFVKNDSVRSCLIELQSFLQSKLMSTQYTVFWCFLPCFIHVLCMTRFIQVDRVRILLVFGPWDPQAERILSVCCSKIWPPGINPELMMECKLIAHPTWYMYWKKLLWITTLSCKVGSMRLRPEWRWRARRYKDCSYRISTILVYFLVSSSSCHAFLPLVVKPMMTIQEMFLKILFDSPEFNRSIIFSR